MYVKITWAGIDQFYEVFDFNCGSRFPIDADSIQSSPLNLTD